VLISDVCTSYLIFSYLVDARTATDRIFEVLQEDNTIVDPETPETVAAPRGELAFRGVHFRYQDAAPAERDLLDGIDLVLEPGETMALVGLTGSGKTTLTALATRLYDVTGGAVRLDGVDIRDLSREELRLDELRTHISMAFEDATLFSASVRDNVLLGRDDLDPDSPEAQAVLDESLQIAQAQFAYELPDGVDTLVGEEGLSLSGGQRQRLALARAVAIAKNANSSPTLSWPWVASQMPSRRHSANATMGMTSSQNHSRPTSRALRSSVPRSVSTWRWNFCRACLPRPKALSTRMPWTLSSTAVARSPAWSWLWRARTP
jgi:ABC-type lipoprotein export system ATPase subunit